GTGFESYWLGKRLEKMWSLYWWHPNEAHNGYLETYLTLGWIGLISLGVLLIAGYRSALNEFRRNPDTGRLRRALFVVVVAYNFTESAIRTMNPIWICLLLTMLGVPLAKAQLKQKKAPVPTALPAPKIACLEEA